MININTLNYLNSIGIGASVNSIESYLIDYKRARFVCDLYDYEYDFLNLSKILKEIKPDSSAFSDIAYLESTEPTNIDRIFIEDGFKKAATIYGHKHKNLSIILDRISENDDIDIVALPNVTGLNIKCTYVNGYITKINLVGDGDLYDDITNKFKDKVPKFVSELKEHEIADCYGKLTIFKNKKAFNEGINIECTIMHKLRLGLDTSDIDIVFNDIVLEQHVEEYDNQWDKIEYLREIGFSVPHHALIRSIDESNIKQALGEFVGYFSGIENSSGIIYKYDGYELRDNNSIILDQYSRVIYKNVTCDYKDIFEAKVKNKISLSSGDVIIPITTTECNDNCKVDKVYVEDMAIIDTYSFDIGCSIKFSIINGKPILIQNKK